MSVTSDLMDSRVLGTVHDYGDQALLLEFDSTAEVLVWTEAVREAELLGVLDIVPGSRTVLIKLAGPRYQAPTRQRLAKLQVAPDALSEVTAPPDGRADVEIDVVYDGEDLDEVARLTGLTVAQVVEAHTGSLWRAGLVVSHPVSPTSSAATLASKSPGDPSRARKCPRGPSGSPANSAACTRGSPPADGS